MKVNQLLGSVLNDNNEFTDKEQSFIIRSLFDKFKDVKSQERQTALNKANEITESLKLLK